MSIFRASDSTDFLSRSRPFALATLITLPHASARIMKSRAAEQEIDDQQPCIYSKLLIDFLRQAASLSLCHHPTPLTATRYTTLLTFSTVQDCCFNSVIFMIRVPRAVEGGFTSKTAEAHALFILEATKSTASRRNSDIPKANRLEMVLGIGKWKRQRNCHRLADHESLSSSPNSQLCQDHTSTQSQTARWYLLPVSLISYKSSIQASINQSINQALSQSLYHINSPTLSIIKSAHLPAPPTPSNPICPVSIHLLTRLKEKGGPQLSHKPPQSLLPSILPSPSPSPSLSSTHLHLRPPPKPPPYTLPPRKNRYMPTRSTRHGTGPTHPSIQIPSIHPSVHPLLSNTTQSHPTIPPSPHLTSPSE